MSEIDVSEQSVPEPGAEPGIPTRLSDLGAEWLAAVPEPERTLADRLKVAVRYSLPAGPWLPVDTMPDQRGTHAALLMQGMIVREVTVGGRVNSQLHGPGDILLPWRESNTSLPASSKLICGSDGAVVAVLDEPFVRVASKWPGVSAVVRERLAQQLDESSLRTAIVSLPRAEQRILSLMWHLADRWGVVRPEGVMVRLQLTHALIGRLIGARRPTVSLALQALTDEGILRRADADTWLLAHDSNETIDWPLPPPALRRLGAPQRPLRDLERDGPHLQGPAGARPDHGPDALGRT